MDTPQIILYFGSFNPIHRGHTEIADNTLNLFPQAALWFVVSPQNPFKQDDDLIDEQDRFNMVSLAIQDTQHKDRISVSDVEFGMPKPTRTADTLRYLSKLHPDYRFSLLIGSDNVDDFDRWKDYEYILDHYPVLVYPRPEYTPARQDILRRCTVLEQVPLEYFQATEIRRNITHEHSRQLTPVVWKYITDNQLYGYSAQRQTSTAIEQQITALNNAILAQPDHAPLYLERGKLYQRSGVFDKALNDFLEVTKIDPTNSEAPEYIKILKEIFDFRYTDIYNP